MPSFLADMTQHASLPCHTRVPIPRHGGCGPDPQCLSHAGTDIAPAIIITSQLHSLIFLGVTYWNVPRRRRLVLEEKRDAFWWSNIAISWWQSIPTKSAVTLPPQRSRSWAPNARESRCKDIQVSQQAPLLHPALGLGGFYQDWCLDGISRCPPAVPHQPHNCPHASPCTLCFESSC